MPKFYIKTVIASFFLGITFTLTILQHVPLKIGLWAIVNLLTFIIINEKMSIREKWNIKGKLIMIIIFLISTYLTFFT